MQRTVTRDDSDDGVLSKGAGEQQIMRQVIEGKRRAGGLVARSGCDFGTVCYKISHKNTNSENMTL